MSATSTIADERAHELSLKFLTALTETEGFVDVPGEETPAALSVQMFVEPSGRDGVPTPIGRPLLLHSTWAMPTMHVSTTRVSLRCGEQGWLLARSGNGLSVVREFDGQLMDQARTLIGEALVGWDHDHVWMHDLGGDDESVIRYELPGTAGTRVVRANQMQVWVVVESVNGFESTALVPTDGGWLVTQASIVSRPTKGAALLKDEHLFSSRAGGRAGFAFLADGWLCVSDLAGTHFEYHPTPFADLDYFDTALVQPGWDGVILLVLDQVGLEVENALLLPTVPLLEAGPRTRCELLEVGLHGRVTVVEADATRLRLWFEGGGAAVVERPLESDFVPATHALTSGVLPDKRQFESHYLDEEEEEGDDEGSSEFLPLPTASSTSALFDASALQRAPICDEIPIAWCLLSERGLLTVAEDGVLSFWRPGMAEWAHSETRLNEVVGIAASPNGQRLAVWTGSDVRAFTVGEALVAGRRILTDAEVNRALISDDGVLFVEHAMAGNDGFRICAYDAACGAPLGERVCSFPSEPPWETCCWATSGAGIGVVDAPLRDHYPQGFGPGYEPPVEMLRSRVGWWHPADRLQIIFRVHIEYDDAVEATAGDGAVWLQIGDERWLASASTACRYQGTNSARATPYRLRPAWAGSGGRQFFAMWEGEVWAAEGAVPSWNLILDNVRGVDCDTAGLVLGVETSALSFAIITLSQSDAECQAPWDFAWPTTTIEPRGLQTYDGKKIGVLTLGGYHVGETATLTKSARRAALDVLYVEDLPKHFALVVRRQTIESWGEKASETRLRALANRIASQARLFRGQKRRDYAVAIAEYEEDLAYLRSSYYRRGSGFVWPETSLVDEEE